MAAATLTLVWFERANAWGFNVEAQIATCLSIFILNCVAPI